MKGKQESAEPCYWSANIYLAEEIAKCADYLIKHNTGYPGIFDRKGVRAKAMTYSKANEKKWRKILGEIRDGFRLYAACDGYFYQWKDGKKATYRRENLPDGGVRLIKTNDAKQILNRQKERKSRRAMELFAKYYDHLWD